MTEIVLATNEQDCARDGGNTAEEFEAIAVTLLRAAEAIRNQEEGKALSWVRLHTCGPDCNQHALANPPAIARFDAMPEPNPSLRPLSLSMIEQYRRLSTQ